MAAKREEKWDTRMVEDGIFTDQDRAFFCCFRLSSYLQFSSIQHPGRTSVLRKSRCSGVWLHHDMTIFRSEFPGRPTALSIGKVLLSATSNIT